MMNAERKQEILRLIRERGRVTVAELSERFAVSSATVRRDLEALASEGVIRRAHGGAIAVERAAPEPPIIQRMAEHTEEKKRIGRAAANLIQDGEAIFLGSGTTTMEVARCLLDRKNLTVVTNALNIANVLAENQAITLILLGGFLRHSELSLIGHLTSKALQELRLDKTFMGMRAISIDEGLTADYLPEVETDRNIMAAARELILVADSSKFGKVAHAFVAPITEVDTIITDSGLPTAIVTRLQELGIRLIIASDEQMV